MRLLLSGLFVAGLVGVAAPVAAGEGAHPLAVVQKIFDTADVDGSGTLTAAEYRAAALQDFGVSFAQSDLDGDGETTLEEYLELYVAHHPVGHEDGTLGL